MDEIDKRLQNLNLHIFDIRNALNKVDFTNEKEARLIISKCLDDLIIEYLRIQNQKR